MENNETNDLNKYPTHLDINPINNVGTNRQQYTYNTHIR